MEFKHATDGGKAETLRAEYYGAVNCSTLKKVTAMYLMDLKMFEYETESFFRMCAS